MAYYCIAQDRIYFNIGEYKLTGEKYSMCFSSNKELKIFIQAQNKLSNIIYVVPKEHALEAKHPILSNF